jgi:hypothetical protein
MTCPARARRILRPLILAACLAGAASAQEPAKGNTVRPEIGKPVQQAADLIKAKKGKDALVKVREAQAVRDKTPFEAYIVERVLGLASALAGDPSEAARAFEAVVASPAAPDGERRQFLAAAAGQYYAAKEYAKAAELSSRYLREGGTDKAMRTLHVQALYLGNNFSAAAKALSSDIEAEEQAGAAPTEEQLQLLSNAYLQQRDTAGYGRALEKLLAHYPKRDYWLAALYGVATQPGFSERLTLDLARLKIATGLMRTAAEYFDAVQLSLQAGFPMEALKILEQGYAAGLLGTGPEAERHKRMRALVDKDLAADTKAIAQEEAKPPAPKDGKTLLNDGFNYVLHGKTAKGLEMMEQGLRLGSGINRPEHAKMQLAYGCYLAGQNQKAIQAYKSVQGSDGAAALAHLWIVRLKAS